jgi:hypothetical protein
MQSRLERQDASLSTADIVLRVNCFDRCCRQWDLTIQAGPRVPAGLAAAGLQNVPQMRAKMRRLRRKML